MSEVYSSTPEEENANVPTPQSPTPLEPIFDSFPPEMQRLRNWVLWKYEYRPGQTKPWTKVPYNPHNGHKAMTNCNATWGTFITAEDRFKKYGSGKGDVAGLGFCLSGDVVGIDLDDCRDPDTGIIEPWATDIIDDINSYTEISPSGKGIRIFARGTVPPGRKKTSKGPGIEIYVSPSWRFLTVTGHRLPSTPSSLQKRTPEIAKLHAELFPPEPEPTVKAAISHATEPGEPGPVTMPTDADDAAVIELATANPKIADLWAGRWKDAGYTDQSTADLALANYLAYYVGPDHDRIHDLFESSGLYRDKWDEKRGTETYGDMTVAKALAGRTDFYDWTPIRAEERLSELFDRVSEAKVSEPAPEPAQPVTVAPHVGQLDAVIAALNAETAAKDEKTDRRFFEDGNDILNLPDPNWLIDDFIMENSFGMIFGTPGSYKTFFAVDMALSLAHGLPFLNHFPVNKEIPVAYISPEGTAGLKNRLKGWMHGRNVATLRNFKVNRNAFALTDTDEVAAVVTQLAKTGVRPKMLFVDTLARNFGGGDENSTRDMNTFVNNVLDLAKELDLGVIVVHHSGKDSGRGARGSIALTGAVDWSIELTKPDTVGADTATVRCRKQKETEEFKPFTVKADRYHADGQTYISLSHHEGIEKGEDEGKKVVGIGDIKPVLELMGPDPEHAVFISKIVTKMGESGGSASTTRRYVQWAIDNEYAIRTGTARPYKVYLATRGMEQVKIWNLVS